MAFCRAYFGLFVILFLIGCSQSSRPPLGRVSGTITLDSQPLEGVIINFRPDKGRTATSQTDSEGHYELEYEYQVKGALVGPSTVSFVWPTGAEDKSEIPAKYAAESEIKYEVKAGNNTFDFDIKP